MRLKRKFRNIIASVAFGSMVMVTQPAHAFVWPVIDFGQIVGFVHSLANGMSQLSTANAQIQNYTSTIHSIGDQISAAAKYVADMRRSIAKIEANIYRITVNIERSDKSMKAIMGEVQSKVKSSEDDNANIAESTEGNISQSIGGGRGGRNE